MIKNKNKRYKESILYRWEETLFDWLTKNKHAIFRMLICALVLMFLPFLPYINLFVSKMFVFFLLIISASIIFNVSAKKMVFVSLLLVLFGLPMILMRKYATAELFANFAYGILFVGVIKMMADSASD